MKDVVQTLEMPEPERRRRAAAARNRVLAAHTARQRAQELETYLEWATAQKRNSFAIRRGEAEAQPLTM
jgi:hypothetical protein